MLHILDTSGVILSPEEAQRAHYAGRLFLLSYQSLAEEALANEVAQYKMRPKFHYLCHVVDDLQKYRWNPRFFHCFMEEDFVGQLGRLVSKTHRNTASMRALQRHCLVLRERWYGTTTCRR